MSLRATFCRWSMRFALEAPLRFHTGHDETKSYGSKTREWQMDTVIHLQPVKRDDTDISFSLEFRKARERAPQDRSDFADLHVALVDGRWEHKEGKKRPGHV